jgi:hypothetical protein
LIDPNNISIKKPDIDSIKEVEVGNPIISRDSGYRYKAISITKKYIIKTGKTLRELKVGDIFINDGFTDIYDLYSNIDGQTFGIAVPKKAGTFKAFTKSGDFVTFHGDDIAVDYEETLNPAPQKKHIIQEFIYNGKVNNAIKFTYREFVNDLARPAFTQDLQYDLNESNIIGFRGLRIEIILATNTNIKYKVLNNFID